MKIFSLIWIGILVIVYLCWTINCWDDFFIYWSWNHTKEHKYWHKRGRIYSTSWEFRCHSFRVWLVIHIILLFLSSLVGFIVRYSK